MSKLIILQLPVLLILSLHLNGQDISRRQADALINVLSKNNDRAIRINAFLALAQFYIFKEGNRRLDFDSAVSFIEEAKKLNAKENSQIAEGTIELFNGYLAEKYNQFKIPKDLFEKSISLLRTTNDKYHLAMAYVELLNYYAMDPRAFSKIAALKDTITRILGDADHRDPTYFAATNRRQLFSKIDYVDEDWPLGLLNDFVLRCRLAKDPEDEIWARKQIADEHLRLSKTELAETELLKLLEDYKATGYPHICNTYDLLAGVYINEYKYTKALYYAFEAIKSMTPDDSLCVVFFYIRINNIFSLLGKTDESIEWTTKVINYYSERNETSDVYQALRVLAGKLIQVGKAQEALQFISTNRKRNPPKTTEDRKEMFFGVAKCYAALDNRVLAEKYFLEAIQQANVQKKTDEITHNAALDYDIGIFYVNNKQFGKAELFLKEALLEMPNEEAYHYISAYKGLFQVDSAAGKYLSAIRNLKIFQNLKDSVYNISRNKQIEELEVTYNTQEKDKDIKILQEKAKVELIQLSKAENTRNWIIAGSVMLTLLLAVSYSRYLIKHRSNQQLRNQQEKLNSLVKEKDGLLTQKDHLLIEKEWLLKEVHHRVKNNLHTVICLLESQAAYLADDALEAIHNSQHRIYAMSLIHQKLYQSIDVKSIDMSIYLPEFIGYLNDSFNTYGQIRFLMKIEPIKLDVSHAIPLALIINEAVTNSIKYAFFGKNTGLITIEMYRLGGQTVLKIADDGIGLPPDIFKLQANSLGFKLMNGLSEEINAEISFKNENGTKIMITLGQDHLTIENTHLPVQKEIYT